MVHSENPMLHVFVYGTLKKGFRNHDHHCQGVLSVEPAVVVGRLYDLGVGYPAMQIPESAILAHGSIDHVADVCVLAEHSASQYTQTPVESDEWGDVHGEVLSFAYPYSQLEAMDRLEGFRPGRQSHYLRVMTYALWDGALQPVWVYVMPEIGRGKLIADGVWVDTR